jgi:hypothetical protein
MFSFRVRRVALAAVAGGALLAGPMPSQAAAPGALTVQASSPVIAGFASADVLYDPAGFPIRGVARPNAKYAAFGVVNGQVQVRTSADGQTWAAAQAARLRDPAQGDVPLVLGNQNRVAVAYVPANILPHNYQFVMVYAPQGGNPSGQASDTVFGADYQRLNNLRFAMSPNGVEWYDDDAVVSDATTEPVIKSGTFKNGILGPTDLIYNPGGDCYDTVTPTTLDWGTASPFACEFTLVYTAVDSAGNTSVALAGGIFFVDIGLQFRGATAPALSRTAASWSSAGIDRAHITRNGSNYVMGVSGSTTAQSCVADTARCSAGIARSTNGNTFTPDNASTPSISASQAEAVAGASPRSVHDLQLIGSDAAEWLSSFSGSTWNATAPVNVGTAPRVTFLKPQSGFITTSEPLITFVLNDDGTTGAGMGIAMPSLSITLGGAPLNVSYTLDSTQIGAVNAPGILVTIPGDKVTLADGDHELRVSAQDLDGETVTASRVIRFDRTPGNSTIADFSTSGFSYPFASVFVQGQAIDTGAATGLNRMRGTIINPLGQRKVVEQGPFSIGDANGGFTFRNLGARVPNGGPVSFDFNWAVPTTDALFWAVPGTYRIEVTSIDYAGNTEGSTSQNSVALLLI